LSQLQHAPGARNSFASALGLRQFALGSIALATVLNG
jgi:hypothetical protein